MKQFLAYLRGIETLLKLSMTQYMKQFLAYLRGIETNKKILRRRRACGFLAYLRGIETLLQRNALHRRRSVFSLPKRD